MKVASVFKSRLFLSPFLCYAYCLSKQGVFFIKKYLALPFAPINAKNLLWNKILQTHQGRVFSLARHDPIMCWNYIIFLMEQVQIWRCYNIHTETLKRQLKRVKYKSFFPLVLFLAVPIPSKIIPISAWISLIFRLISHVCYYSISKKKINKNVMYNSRVLLQIWLRRFYSCSCLRIFHTTMFGKSYR